MGNEVRYARSGDVHIAYRVFGDGPRDLVLIPGTLSHAEIFWEFPINQSLLKRFMSFARVIVFDKRGQGLSDRVGEQTLEERICDVCAVMDAVRQLGLEVRAGLHTGECEVAGSKVSGIAVHTGAGIAAAARPQEVLASATVRDLVAGSGIQFDDRGRHVLKGVPGDWRLFAVTSS